MHEYAGSLLTNRLMNISAKGLEEDKNHFGVFLRFLLHRPENMFINRDYDNFISTDVRQRKVSEGFKFQVSGFKIQEVSSFRFQVSGAIGDHEFNELNEFFLLTLIRLIR